MTECEQTLRLVLLAVAIYSGSTRTEADMQAMLKSIAIDCLSPKEMVKREWLKSHGFMEEGQ